MWYTSNHEQVHNVSLHPDSLEIQVYQLFPFTNIPMGYIVKELCHLDSTKATDIDSINTNILKDVSHVVAAPLTDIMNSFLSL